MQQLQEAKERQKRDRWFALHGTIQDSCHLDYVCIAAKIRKTNGFLTAGVIITPVQHSQHSQARLEALPFVKFASRPRRGPHFSFGQHGFLRECERIRLPEKGRYSAAQEASLA